MVDDVPKPEPAGASLYVIILNDLAPTPKSSTTRLYTPFMRLASPSISKLSVIG